MVSVLSLMKNGPDVTKYDGLERLIPSIESISDVVDVVVPLVEGELYKGDFYGLLRSMYIDESLWYLTLRVNGLLDTSEWANDRLNIRVVRSTTAYKLLNDAIKIKDLTEG